MSGLPAALNYAVAYRWMDAEGIELEKQNDLLSELQLIESGALQALREKQDRQSRGK